MSWIVVYETFGWVIIAAMVPAILRRQFAPGAAMAWLVIICLHPYIGWALYMLVGETRLGPHRVERHRELVARYRCTPEVQSAGLTAIHGIAPEYAIMVRQAEKISTMPVVAGNCVDFIGDSPQMIDRLISDIDTAEHHVHLLYYMFSNDQSGQRTAEAARRAASRGVKCRVLADAVASRTFFHHNGLSRGLREAGVEVAAALPVALIQRRLSRMDLRNHRKLAVIDAKVAYCGSQNLINADYGGRHGAPWVDLSARLTGPIVSELAIVFAEDWGFETGTILDAPAPQATHDCGDQTLMQVVPTGPTSPGENYRRLLLAALQCARQRVSLTTPYFVPDDPTLVAFMMAADRGVEVTLILPKVGDHFFTAAAGRAHFGRLLEAGIRIHLFKPGLLHGKTVVVDQALALIGSANLDVRSFNLNFELTVLMYGTSAVNRLADIHAQYIAQSIPVDPAQWARRSPIKRYADSAISLLSPLL
ncbi:MAG TPA: cardiolipin synthase [Tepidisphaeraceae bacterium]